MTNILLIEDQPTICMEVERALKLAAPRVNIITCDNLHRASNLLIGSVPDLIILDLILANGTAEQTIEAIPLFEEIAPLVILSGTGLDYFAKCIRAGALAFLDKPTYLRRGYEAFFVNHLIGAIILWKRIHGHAN